MNAAEKFDQRALIDPHIFPGSPSTRGMVVLTQDHRATPRSSADGRMGTWVVQEPAAAVPDALTHPGAHKNGAQLKAPDLQMGRCFATASCFHSKELASSREPDSVL